MHDAAFPVEYFPASQFEQEDACAAEYVPAPQLEHDVKELALLLVPVAHATHVDVEASNW